MAFGSVRSGPVGRVGPRTVSRSENRTQAEDFGSVDPGPSGPASRKLYESARAGIPMPVILHRRELSRFR